MCYGYTGKFNTLEKVQHNKNVTYQKTNDYRHTVDCSERRPQINFIDFPLERIASNFSEIVLQKIQFSNTKANVQAVDISMGIHSSRVITIRELEIYLVIRYRA